MKLSVKTLLYNLICIYPAINILVCYLSSGNNMLIFSLIYCCILIVIIFVRKGFIERSTLWIILAGVVTVILSFFRELYLTNVSSSILFAVTMIFLLFYSESYFGIQEFGSYFLSKKTLFYFAQIIFYAILYYHYLVNGLRYGWSTKVLQGPYNYPHTLAYLLLLMIMADVYLWVMTKSRLGFLLAGINLILIFLTAVRVVLMVSCFSILFIVLRFMSGKQLRKLLIFLTVGVCILLIASRYGIFQALIQKTNLAIKNSSITNGRLNIAQTSMRALMADGGGKIVNCVFGVGMQNLLRSNFIFLRAAIHAHNDVIDVLVCYGVINAVLYTYSFFRFARRNKFWIFLCIGGLALGNGLFMYIDSIPMLIFARLFFEMPQCRADCVLGKSYRQMED